MLCTNCSAPIRPVVAIDIDGTLGDYHTHFIDFASLWLGREIASGVEVYSGQQPFHDWFAAAFDVDLTMFRNIKLAYRQGGLKRSMPPYPGAHEFVASIREQAEVWITTTRPHDRFDRVDPDTREWLARCDIPFDGLLFSDRKMEELAARVSRDRVCFVIDDLQETLVRAEQLFLDAGTVLRVTEYNSNGPGWSVMTGNLLDARAMAVAHVQDWTIKHSFDNLPTTGD